MKKFYDIVREKFFKKDGLTQDQVDNINLILETAKEYGIENKHQIAYILATAYHETAHTMVPVEEYGRGAGRPYGKKIRMDRKSYAVPNKLYYGRGHVQLTWYENYERMGKIINADLLNKPELALVPAISARILVQGMLKGFFTGKGLNDYFTSKKNDSVNARKIVNGLDKAKLISGYYNTFLKALNA